MGVYILRGASGSTGGMAMVEAGYQDRQVILEFLLIVYLHPSELSCNLGNDRLGQSAQPGYTLQHEWFMPWVRIRGETRIEKRREDGRTLEYCSI